MNYGMIPNGLCDLLRNKFDSFFTISVVIILIFVMTISAIVSLGEFNEISYIHLYSRANQLECDSTNITVNVLELGNGSVIEEETEIIIEANGAINVTCVFDNEEENPLTEISPGKWFLNGLHKSNWPGNGPHQIDINAQINSNNYTETITANFIATGGIWRVLISEIMFNPEIDTEQEFFELVNAFPFSVRLDGWTVIETYIRSFRNVFSFENEREFPAMSTMVFARDFDGFLSEYGVTPDFVFNFSLANVGDAIALTDKNEKWRDSVAWGSDSARVAVPEELVNMFPYNVVPVGQSIHRTPIWMDTNDMMADFVSDEPTPGNEVSNVPSLSETLTFHTNIKNPSLDFLGILLVVPIILLRRFFLGNFEHRSTERF